MTDRTPALGATSGYTLRVAGRLAGSPRAWFEGLTIIDGADGTTVITWPRLDQPALHGVLGRIRDLGLPLIAVTRIDHTEP